MGPEARGVDDVLARTSTASVGHAALAAAAEIRPGRLIRLRDGVRLIDERKPGGS